MEELINRLENFYRENSNLRGSPATMEQIEKAEQELGVKMHDDYIKFIQKFGGAYAGLAIHAFSNGSSIGKETVIDLTLRARKLFNNTNLFPEINQSYIISNDGYGNPIAISKEGQVVLYDHDYIEKEILAESFSEFIKENFSEW